MRYYQAVYMAVCSCNKINIGGEINTGKTFFALSICKNFLDMDKDAGIIYFESESAVSKNMIEDRGIDIKRFVVVLIAKPYKNLEHNQLKLLTSTLEQSEKDRNLLCLF